MQTPSTFEIAAIEPTAAAALARAINGDAPRRPARQESRRSTSIALVYLEGVLWPDYLAEVRRQLLAAERNPDVSHVVLRVNSPGGLVEGVPETAEVVRRVAKAKGATVIADGYLASGAVWITAGATRIVAAPSTKVGSVGVVSVLVDDSKLFEAAGVRVIPVATAESKGVGIPGVAITEADVERVKRLVDAMGRQFLLHLRQARRMTAEQVSDAGDADVYLADEAKQRGYVDEVALVEDALDEIHARQRETFSDLYGEAALDRFRELCCAEARIDRDDWDAIPSRIERSIAKSHPQLAARAMAHHESQQRRRAWKP